MKKIKSLAALGLGALATFLTSPFVAKAAEEAAEAESKGEVLSRALLNTVMSIAIVFAALILIAWIISLFKYINKFEQKLAAKKAAKNAPAEVTAAPAPAIEMVEEEELSDDLELVAVITAAIHAYEEAQGNDIPADAQVVRSIRKVNKNKWQNA